MVITRENVDRGEILASGVKLVDDVDDVVVERQSELDGESDGVGE